MPVLTVSLKTWVLQKLKITSGDRTRKPRYVWSNPIAWREAKTKASAARASVMRYGFMAAGILGALAATNDDAGSLPGLPPPARWAALAAAGALLHGLAGRRAAKRAGCSQCTKCPALGARSSVMVSVARTCGVRRPAVPSPRCCCCRARAPR